VEKCNVFLTQQREPSKFPNSQRSRLREEDRQTTNELITVNRKEGDQSGAA